MAEDEIGRGKAPRASRPTPPSRRRSSTRPFGGEFSTSFARSEASCRRRSIDRPWARSTTTRRQRRSRTPTSTARPGPPMRRRRARRTRRRPSPLGPRRRRTSPSLWPSLPARRLSPLSRRTRPWTSPEARSLGRRPRRFRKDQPRPQRHPWPLTPNRSCRGLGRIRPTPRPRGRRGPSTRRSSSIGLKTCLRGATRRCRRGRGATRRKRLWPSPTYRREVRPPEHRRRNHGLRSAADRSSTSTRSTSRASSMRRRLRRRRRPGGLDRGEPKRCGPSPSGGWPRPRTRSPESSR